MERAGWCTYRQVGEWQTTSCKRRGMAPEELRRVRSSDINTSAKTQTVRSPSVSAMKRFLSHASAALDTSSRRKTSLLEYREFTMMSMTSRQVHGPSVRASVRPCVCPSVHFSRCLFTHTLRVASKSVSTLRVATGCVGLRRRLITGRLRSSQPARLVVAPRGSRVDFAKLFVTVVKLFVDCVIKKLEKGKWNKETKLMKL